MNELYRENKDQGLVLIGIHTEGDAEKMPAFVAKAGIEFPVCIDAGAIRDFGVDSYPDYYLIDRAGKVRVADLANGSLDDAVALLLAEPAPLPLPGDAACEDSPLIQLTEATALGKKSWSLTTRRWEGPDEVQMVDKFYQDPTLDSSEWMTFTLRAQNDGHLTPHRLFIIGSGPEDFWEYVFEPKKDHLLVHWKFGVVEYGEPDAFRVPLETVLDLAIPRIVTQRPFEIGSSAAFPLFSVRERRHAFNEQVTLECMGSQSAKGPDETSDPRTVWRYDLRAGDEILESFWVDEIERTLVKMKLGSGPLFETHED